MIDVEKLRQAVGALEEDKVMEMLDCFIDSRPDGPETQQVVSACQNGMEMVGKYYEDGEYFVGDLIFAGELLTDCVERLKPLLASGSGQERGVIVLGTVVGDIHDIGKNIFKSMVEAAGYRVVDIGIDQPPNAFAQAVKDTGAQIVGLSGVLTLSIDSMKKTVEELEAEGLRRRVKVLIGGNAVSAEACEHIGADAWSRNAADAVRICGELVAQ